ncbi:MAG TPA: choice-of-anchor tandem repeat GloVer-containing protein [Candidatus Cybelea sp.]|jgi:uncharacterized repeat protein (TIGR03803 family)
MNTPGFLTCIGAAAALLAGCGGSQPPIGAPDAMPQSRGIAARGDNSNYKVLYRFHGPDGALPDASLIDVHGVLYGTTQRGGTIRRGTVFSITTRGREKTLYSFKGAPDGEDPEARLLDVNGTLYSTTFGAGANNCAFGCGSVFSVSTFGAEKVLYSFQGNFDGAWPVAPLINVNGALYGTTSGFIEFPYQCDNAEFCGTVFGITASGQEKVLHNFDGPNGSDGADPVAGLIDVNGTLYGTTEYGGVYSGSGCSPHSDKYGCGTVFSITTSGTEKALHSFGSGTDGSLPRAGLVAVKGVLYGTTYAGGPYHEGTVFSINTSGKEKVLHSFGNHIDGAYPAARLIEAGGMLYGTTVGGGGGGSTCVLRYGSGCGTVYRISPSGAETVLHSFGGGSDGANPHAALLNVAGVLYGTTTYGGRHDKKCNHRPGCGTVFALSL